MKKITLMLSLMMLLIAGTASAQVQSPYIVSFNDSISTLMHDFRVAPGWNHVVGMTSSENRFVNYTWNKTGGVDDSGCLQVGSQNLRADWDYEEVYDLLVSPTITGKASIKVKLERSSGSVTIYKVKKENGQYVRDEDITPNGLELSKDSYTTVEVTGLNNERIGIRAENAYLDDFMAESANVVLSRGLSFSKFEPSNLRTPDADATNHFNVEYKVAVTNTGDLDLDTGTEGYNLYLVADTAFRKSLRDTLLVFPITQPLSAGQTSDTYTLSVSVDATKYPDNTRYSVYEGISGKMKEGTWMKPFPYEPVMTIRPKDQNNRLEAGATIDFGLTNQEVSKEFVIRNDGAAPLVINEVSLPADFRVDTALPLNVEPHASQSLFVTMLPTGAEEKSGDMVIKGTKTEFSIKLKGNLVPEGKWFVNFEDNKIPNSFMVEGNKGWSVDSYPETLRLPANKYCADAADDGSSKLISPKVEVANGDKLTFQAARHDESSFLNIYYSPDRKTWTKVRSISATADNATDKLSDETSGYYKYVFSTFTVDNIPAGQWYIAFESGYTRLDNILGYKLVPVEHDVAVSEQLFPTTVTANHEMEITATLSNLTDNTEPADSYAATLYFNGEAVETATGKELTAGENVQFSFKTTPHKAGSYKAYVKFEGPNLAATTDTVTVTVTNEVARKIIQVGTPGDKIDGKAPVHLYYSNSQSESIYTAEQLGLSAGAKINKIIYKGRLSLQMPSKLKVWMANTTDGTYTEPIKPTDPATMTSVFDGKYLFEDVGSEKQAADLLVVNLPQPFTFDGNNLRIRVECAINSYSSSYFEYASDIPEGQTILREWDGFETNYSITKYTPVLYIETDSEPKVLRGKVTDAAGKAMPNAYVSATSGNVVYDATTDANGEYSMTVYQDEKTYELNVTVVGYTPHKENVKLTENTTRDIQLTTATGLYIDNVSFPEEATVNHEYTATVTALNTITSDIAAANYTATLYVDGEAVATAASQNLASGKRAVLSFAYYPHSAGMKKAVAVLKSATSTAKSDTIPFTVKNEDTETEVIVGDPSDSESTPINTYYKHSESQTIYTAGQLGLKPGAIITRITFKGYSNHDSTIQPHVRAYLENTDDAPAKTLVERDTTAMTKIADQNVEISSSGSNDHMVDKLVFDIEGGFVYTGGNLRLAVTHDCDGFHTVYFATDRNAKAFGRKSDNDDLSTKEWEETQMPVAYLTVNTSRHLTGFVKDSKTNEPLADVNITLTSGNVQYSATTDANGAYDVTIAQPALSYKATYSVPGYDSVEENITFGDNNLSKDITMSKNATGIDSAMTQESKKIKAIYNINGQRTDKLASGVNIVQYADGTTRKIIVR